MNVAQRGDPFALLRGAASAMEAQREALAVEARNIAAAQAAGPKGRYARDIPEFALKQESGAQVLRFAGTRRERGEDVDVLTEMVAVMNASRAYEADVAVFDIGKELAQHTVEMGRL